LNPVSFTTPVLTELSEGAEDAQAGVPEGEFTVTVAIGNGPAASRSVAGPNYANITGNKLMNFAQIIVADGAGKIVSFDEKLRHGDGDDPTLNVNVRRGAMYHFLVLMGHWPYNGAQYEYDEGKLPTLLAAGFVSRLIGDATPSVDITMKPLAVDIVFVPADSSLKRVEPRSVGSGACLIPGDWRVDWTIQRAYSGNGARENGLDPLLEARQAIGGGELFERALLSSNGGAAAANPNLSITGNLVSLQMSALGVSTGSVNFNLEYVPFGLRDVAGWADFAGKPGMMFDLTKKTPMWMLRNGVNDKAQDGSTDFSSVGVGGKNGNGAVKYQALAAGGDEDNDGLANEDEVRAGTDPGTPNGGDTDGDGFPDTIEVANGFDPLDGGDNPNRGNPGALGVANGKAGTRSDAVTEIVFTAGGFTGTAHGYYKVVGHNAAAPALADYGYEPLERLAVEPKVNTVEVTLAGPWDNAYDVYVVIMKDRNVSVPALISLTGVSSPSVPIEW
jgi:hypothetical protein